MYAQVRTEYTPEELNLDPKNPPNKVGCTISHYLSTLNAFIVRPAEIYEHWFFYTLICLQMIFSDFYTTFLILLICYFLVNFVILLKLI